MDGGIQSAFVVSLQKMMTAMLGVPCLPVSRNTIPRGAYLSASVQFTGASNGSMVLSLPIRTARQSVAAVLGMSPGGIDEYLVRDGVGEMANIVAGNARSYLANRSHKLLMQLPRVVVGEGDVPGSQATDRAHFGCFESPYGALALAIWLT